MARPNRRHRACIRGTPASIRSRTHTIWPRTFAGSDEDIEASLLNYPDFMVFDLDPYIYAGSEAKETSPH